jgi:hypothetical protein
MAAIQFIVRLLITAAAWYVVTLFLDVVVDVTLGSRPPGLIPLLTLPLFVPIFMKIWRPDPRS